MLLTAMHDNPNQGFWQANAKIIRLPLSKKVQSVRIGG